MHISRDMPHTQDKGSANVLLSNVSISIDWAAAAAAAAEGGGSEIVSVLVKIGDLNLKFAGVISHAQRHAPIANCID